MIMKTAKTKKVNTTLTINPKILELLKESTTNNSRLVEWLLLRYFKEIGEKIDDIIL